MDRPILQIEPVSEKMHMLPTVSVIIPTYNRKEFLRQTLASLARQDCFNDSFEVIVVDDGSKDGTDAIADEEFPFALRYFYQANQGDAIARNTGAQQSQADILVFLDDDILVSPGYLHDLVQEHTSSLKRIVVGTEKLWLAESDPIDHDPLRLSPTGQNPGTVDIPFADVCSNNMSIRRDAYFAIGMMQDLGFPGSSIWCDVDFTFRAYRQGFEFRRSPRAICWHRDHVSQSLDSRIKRVREAGYRAVALFQKYPELIPFVPMFEDKTAIDWGRDDPRLIMRKLARPVTSSGIWLWGMEQLFTVLERTDFWPGLRRALSRWIIGGRLYQGYRAGLRELQTEKRQHAHGAPANK